MIKFFKYAKKLIDILDKLEAVTSILESIGTVLKREAERHKQTLRISEKQIQQLEGHVKKVTDIDKTLEDIQKKVK
tara:strand:- start:173 stop:400 length:228 start_codon:yes stop_codon:yes gene_type:complete